MLQRVEYLTWLDEVRSAVSSGGLGALGFDYQGGHLLFYELTACPNCNNRETVQSQIRKQIKRETERQL